MFMLLSNGNLPDLNKHEKSGDKVKALLEYIFTMRQEINHVLCNLDEGNLSKNLRQSIAEGSQQTTALQKTGGTQETAQPSEPEGITLEKVYPVGSIYFSVNSTSPEVLFGGTWERIQDAFLLAAGDTYEAGSEGGEANHKLTIGEMPSHNHKPLHHQSGEKRIALTGLAETGASYYKLTYTNTSGYEGTSISTGEEGGGNAHNNMPPYLTVYVWKRTA